MASRGNPATPPPAHGHWRRLTVASATMSAGACVFFVAGTGAASATTHQPAAKATTSSTCDLACQVRNTLDKITGAGHQANPPSSPGSGHTTTGHSGSTHSGSTTKHTSSSSSHSTSSSHSARSSSESSSTSGVTAPMSVPDSTAPVVAAPQTAQLPQLPEIAGDQNPVVFPDQPKAPAQQVHLISAAAQDQTMTISPEVVAAAAGIIGIVAALNLSVLSRWLRRQPTR
jgi:hypothetical protein